MSHHLFFASAVAMSILSLTIQRKHLLMSLLCLEAIILTLIPLLTFTMGTPLQNNTFLFIILLTLGACEASLGLSLLVSMTRSFGSDLVSLLTINKC